MGIRLYRIEGKKIIPCKDVMEWASWYESTSERAIAHTQIPGTDLEVSTIFLAMDLSLADIIGGSRELFETMVFDNGRCVDGSMRRYSTYEEAETGHRETVEKFSKNERD